MKKFGLLILMILFVLALSVSAELGTQTVTSEIAAGEGTAVETKTGCNAEQKAACASGGKANCTPEQKVACQEKIAEKKAECAKKKTECAVKKAEKKTSCSSKKFNCGTKKDAEAIENAVSEVASE